jgi:broad specificity phosphatase PhoE
VTSPRRFLLARHGRSTYNAEGRLNGDPSVPVGLDPQGVREAVALRDDLAGEPLDLAGHTRLLRTVETLDLALDGRPVPRMVFPEFDDIRLGAFEGMPVADYRAWRRRHDDDDPLPAGESRLEALARYADGYRRLLDTGARCAVLVLHDIPIRFLANAARGEDPLHGPVRTVPNAVVVPFTEDDLARAVAAMRARLAS